MIWSVCDANGPAVTMKTWRRRGKDVGLNIDVFCFWVWVYFGPRGIRIGAILAVSHMAPRMVSSASQWQWPCGVMGAVNGMWCMCGGLRCAAAASPPVLLFGAPPEQPPGLVAKEKQSYISLLLIAHSALRSAMRMSDLMQVSSM